VLFVGNAIIIKICLKAALADFFDVSPDVWLGAV
jgi:hypothetical protein